MPTSPNDQSRQEQIAASQGPLSMAAESLGSATLAAGMEAPALRPGPVILAPPPSLLRRAAHAIGVDRAIAFTVLARGWSACAGLVTVALIARKLSLAEQGFYYTFGSLVALQIIFELGFSVVILQLATHEVAHLTIGPEGTVSGPGHHHARLASVLRRSLKWYSIAAVLMALFLLPVGWHFFAAADRIHPGIGWRLPWTAVVLASSFTFQIDPVFSFLEGCGYVANSARTRLAQSVLGGLLAWTALALHHGLLAPAFVILGQAAVGIVWIATHRRLLRHLLNHTVGRHAIDWWQEVWPFQWRIAVSYACGFFIYQLFNPVLFRYAGAAEAGKMGMSLSLSNAIGAVAIAWINTKAAPFGALIARRQFLQLDRLFTRSLIQALLLCALGSAAVLTANIVLHRTGSPYAARVLAPLPFAFLLLAMMINQIVFSMALYLRAHKQEKFLLNSVIGAVSVAVSTWFLGRAYGSMGIVAGQLVIAVILGLGFGSYTFFHNRKLLHA